MTTIQNEPGSGFGLSQIIPSYILNPLSLSDNMNINVNSNYSTSSAISNNSDNVDDNSCHNNISMVSNIINNNNNNSNNNIRLSTNDPLRYSVKSSTSGSDRISLTSLTTESIFESPTLTPITDTI